MQDVLQSILRIRYELLLVWLVWIYWTSWCGQEGFGVRALRAGQQRQRHPQSPRDCPVCRAGHGVCETRDERVVEPWARQKSKRGRPKIVETDGHGCPNPRCP